MRAIIVFLSFINFSFAANNQISHFKKVFPNLVSLKKESVPDPLKEPGNNNYLFKAYDKKKKLLGFIREVNTTTGCNDGCLPVTFELFYRMDGKFKKLLSKKGLTKKYHEKFSPEDYLNLEIILSRNPSSFKKVLLPTELVDGISRATKKEYKNDVIPRAAYTTLRVNMYHQHTLEFLKRLIK